MDQLYSNENLMPILEQFNTDSVCEDEVFEQKAGVVTDCERLNVRETPSVGATVVAVLPALSSVTVDLEQSTEDFYKVCTAEGVEGFCMKRYRKRIL